MTAQYRRASADEYEDLIDFANFVFQINFAELLPKLYSGHPELAQYHYLALEEGKIKGLVASIPLDFSIDGETVRAFGIGTVSVHPEARGKGYMKELMNRAIADAKADGADLMCLGGQRQRYEYFGFSKACVQRNYTLTPNNRRHWERISTKGIDFLPLSESCEYAESCWQLHQMLPIHAKRNIENFAEICRSWSCEAWAIRKNRQFLGYCILNADCTAAAELLLSDWQEVLPVLFALSEKAGKDLSVTPFSWQKELNRALSLVSEGGAVSDGEMVRFLNFPRMLKLLLQRKARQSGLSDGSLVLEIPGEGKYLAAAENGVVSIEETTKPADWSLSAVEMQNRIISVSNLWQYDSLLENSWFPLPFELPNHDMV